MNDTYKAIRNEIKNVIIAKNGNVLNADILPIYDRFKPIVGRSVVTMVQDALSHFRFSPSQANFRTKYNFQ